MILVFGGSYQGKLDYALERFSFKDSDVYRCDEDTSDMPEGFPIVYELDKWILALVKAQSDTSEAVRSFIKSNEAAVVIANDISGGVVPMDSTLRVWREAVGRSLAEIAKASDEVIRVFCGIPTRIK